MTGKVPNAALGHFGAESHKHEGCDLRRLNDADISSEDHRV